MAAMILWLLGTPLALLLYSYLGYPVLLRLLTLSRRAPAIPGREGPWPRVAIVVPCYNEAASIGGTIEHLLRLEYPEDRRQILVISDAATDGTDEIVRTYASRGVELLRLPARAGKTAAENAATPYLRGEIVLITDATIRIAPGALKPLVAAFQDPTIGVASGRDVSLGREGAEGNVGESGYVGYEMWVRSLESRLGTIVGASGCCFASRRELHDARFPESLSRDFAACLIAREHGFRSVSVDDAIAYVPRSASLRAEYHRKVRTMARGLATLWYKRSLLDPLRHGLFAWMLMSHKLCRWLLQLSLPLAAIGVVLLVVTTPQARGWIAGGTVIAAALAALSWYWPVGRTMPRALAVPAYAAWSNVAGLAAWVRFFRGERNAVWAPTRRPAIR